MYAKPSITITRNDKSKSRKIAKTIKENITINIRYTNGNKSNGIASIKNGLDIQFDIIKTDEKYCFEYYELNLLYEQIYELSVAILKKFKEI